MDDVYAIKYLVGSSIWLLCITKMCEKLYKK